MDTSKVWQVWGKLVNSQPANTASKPAGSNERRLFSQTSESWTNAESWYLCTFLYQGWAKVTKCSNISSCHLNHQSQFSYQLQRGQRRTYGPPTGDRNINETGNNQLRVALPPTDFSRQWPEIPRNYLKIAEELGSGAFGVVKKGYLMRNDKVIECAVKMLKSKWTFWTKHNNAFINRIASA